MKMKSIMVAGAVALPFASISHTQAVVDTGAARSDQLLGCSCGVWSISRQVPGKSITEQGTPHPCAENHVTIYELSSQTTIEMYHAL